MVVSVSALLFAGIGVRITVGTMIVLVRPQLGAVVALFLSGCV